MIETKIESIVNNYPIEIKDAIEYLARTIIISYEKGDYLTVIRGLQLYRNFEQKLGDKNYIALRNYKSVP